jgi:hypothetical protein
MDRRISNNNFQSQNNIISDHSIRFSQLNNDSNYNITLFPGIDENLFVMLKAKGYPESEINIALFLTKNYLERTIQILGVENRPLNQMNNILSQVGNSYDGKNRNVIFQEYNEQ